MRLKLPRTGKGKRCTLRVVKKNPVIGGEECWGYYNPSSREIVISEQTQQAGMTREVLIHEMLHALLPFFDEEAVSYLACELDAVLDVVESENILEM